MSEPTKPTWDWKSWTIGLLVALGFASTYAAAKLGGTPAPESQWMTTCSTAHIIFEQKKRCGFEDLDELVTVEGLVIQSTIHADGDFSINVIVDPDYEYLLYYRPRRWAEGKERKTRNYLHVEFMPCERMYADVGPVLDAVAEHVAAAKEAGEKPTMRVRITGRWAYDGVDHRGEWRDQLGNCLGGREADVSVGWTEIHPAYTVEILDGNNGLSDL